VAVVSMGGVVAGRSIRVGGDTLDDAIAGYCRRRFNIALGQQTAEQIKLDVGSAAPGTRPEGRAEVRGRDLATGRAVTAVLEPEEVRPVLEGALGQISETIAATLEATPPELAADLVERGMTLAGGGALLPGLDRRLAGETGLVVRLAERPLTCVVQGAGRALEGGLAGAGPRRLRRPARRARKA